MAGIKFRSSQKSISRIHSAGPHPSIRFEGYVRALHWRVTYVPTIGIAASLKRTTTFIESEDDWWLVWLVLLSGEEYRVEGRLGRLAFR